MSLFPFRMIARGAVIRAALLGILGITALLFPDFLAGGMIYAIAAYAILNGALGILGFVVNRAAKKSHYLTSMPSWQGWRLCAVSFALFITVTLPVPSQFSMVRCW